MQTRLEKYVNSLSIGKISPMLFVLIGLGAFFAAVFYASSAFADVSIPTLSLNLSETDQPDAAVPAIKIIGLLTILTVAPAILLMTTSFTRIIIVLSFIRQALGTQSMPPNQVLVGLALFLTMFTMAPVWNNINQNAFTPYVEKTITQSEAFDRAIVPVRKFMLAQTQESDLAMLMNVASLEKPEKAEDVPMTALMPAFLVSELKTAFSIGFLIYIPFLIIDMVVSAILMAMGMLMLPPTVISLPFKLILFVMVDGWALIVEQIVKSFNLA